MQSRGGMLQEEETMCKGLAERRCGARSQGHCNPTTWQQHIPVSLLLLPQMQSQGILCSLPKPLLMKLQSWKKALRRNSTRARSDLTQLNMETLASSTVLCIKKELRAYCPIGETNRQRNRYKAPQEVLCEVGVGINTSEI